MFADLPMKIRIHFLFGFVPMHILQSSCRRSSVCAKCACAQRWQRRGKALLREAAPRVVVAPPGCMSGTGCQEQSACLDRYFADEMHQTRLLSAILAGYPMLGILKLSASNPDNRVGSPNKKMYLGLVIINYM